MSLRLGVLASGRGSNFVAIAEAIVRGDLDASIRLVVSDRQDAPVLRRAKRLGIDAFYLPYDRSDRRVFELRAAELLEASACELVVLAGFMRIVSPFLLSRFPDRIVNIHPSLLPAFKGMDAQAQALRYGVKLAGCTVHIVNEEMDAGRILGQRAVNVYESDSEAELSARILQEEHQLYPEVIGEYGRRLQECGAFCGTARGTGTESVPLEVT